MDSGARDELVHALTRRRTVLLELADGPRRKRELVAALDVARSTVDRALRTLESEGLVERVDDGFALTTAGAAAFDVYVEFTDRLNAICSCRDVVERLPSGRFVDPEFLRDAEVVRASVSAPDEPVRAFVEMVSQATHARGFSPTAYGAYVDVFEERVVEHGLTADLAFSDEALETLTSSHSGAITRAVETGRVRVRRIPELPGTGLVVLSRGERPPAVAMGVHGGPGLDALVRNDSPAAVEWARELVDEQFERAEEIPL